MNDSTDMSIRVSRCPNCGGIGDYVDSTNGQWQVIACKCGYNAPGIAVAGTQTPPEKMRELQDYATKATADLRAELSRVHHEKEDALDRLSRTEQNVAALKAELKNVERMWKDTIDRNHANQNTLKALREAGDNMAKVIDQIGVYSEEVREWRKAQGV